MTTRNLLDPLILTLPMSNNKSCILSSQSPSPFPPRRLDVIYEWSLNTKQLESYIFCINPTICLYRTVEILLQKWPLNKGHLSTMTTVWNSVGGRFTKDFFWKKKLHGPVVSIHFDINLLITGCKIILNNHIGLFTESIDLPLYDKGVTNLK
jgi:hypothetical protein